mgnify:CR=1 FL=1
MKDKKKLKVKETEDNNMKKGKKKTFFIIATITIVILVILAILLYFNGISRILPIVCFLILPIVIALFIFLLSKNVWMASRKRKEKPAIKIHV